MPSAWLLKPRPPRLPILVEPYLSEFASTCAAVQDTLGQEYLEERCPGCGHPRAYHAPECCRGASRGGWCRCPEYDKEAV